MRMMLTLAAVMLVATAVADEIETLQSVQVGSEDVASAREARDALVEGGTKNLVPILKAFRGSSVLASNWLRSAFETIADRELRSQKPLPADELLDFVNSTSESPEARRLAYEWLLKEKPKLAEELIPTMLLDPSPEFRRDAVARLLAQAKEATGEKAVRVYQEALRGAVHEDQVKTIAKALREADVDVDLQEHFGFLASWKIIGPFDNRDMKGFPVVYPPEETIDLDAEYEGQLDTVRWAPIDTDDDYGVVDIAEKIENYKGSVMYATTIYESGADQSVQFRLGTPNAWKLWVNGEMVFEREEYHRSTRMDQYKIPVALKRGPNTILLKVCQNEQTQPWAQDYQFQLRVCDTTGSAILPGAVQRAGAGDLSNNTTGAN